MSVEFRQEINEEVAESGVRLTKVLTALDIPASSWYRSPVPEDQCRRPGPPPKVIEPHIVETVVKMATENPWYGYQRIAVMCRRLPEAVGDEDAYRVMRQHGLLQKRRRVREPELHQALKLYELLPQRPNDLWQMDVPYLHIPGYGWWYAVTAIDYYSAPASCCPQLGLGWRLKPLRRRYTLGRQLYCRPGMAIQLPSHNLHFKVVEPQGGRADKLKI